MLCQPQTASLTPLSPHCASLREAKSDYFVGGWAERLQYRLYLGLIWLSMQIIILHFVNSTIFVGQWLQTLSSEQNTDWMLW